MRPLIAAWMLLAAPAALAQNDGIDSGGAFMIMMRGERRPAPRAIAPADDPFELLITVPAQASAPMTRGIADAAETQPRYWLSTPVMHRGAGIAGAAALPGRKPWDDAHAILDDPVRMLAAMMDRSEDEMRSMIDPAAVMMVEPDVAMWDRGYGRRLNDIENETPPPPRASVAGTQVTVDPNGAATRAWPAPSAFAWHLGDDYSGLRKARDKAAAHFDQNNAANNVLVFHLDTGYYRAKDGIRPKFLDENLSISYLDNEGFPDDVQPGFDRFGSGFLPLRGHGSSTLSILAGNDIDVKDRGFDEFLGGAPLARVASCRISQSVVHFHPRIIVRAIDDAVAKKADLITMAAGSPPSRALADAVNTAYEMGVPMFFAASDFFQVPILPIRVPPHTTVYPARFNRAVAVTGVTSARKSYGLNSFFGFLNGIGSWALRGSWGPLPVMDHTIAAWSPNVAAQQAYANDTPDIVKERFAGTSAATPQVAAAAALWMQAHKGELKPHGNWERAEAVYQALFAGATKGKQDPDSHFGRGFLNADKTLGLKVADLTLAKRPVSTIGVDWLSIIARLLRIEDDDKRDAHVQMLELELRQLWHASGRLRKMANPDEAMSEEQARRFVKAAAKDERASEYLRRAVSF